MAGKFLENRPCDACRSKDNLSVYQQPDGSLDGYCWTCQKKVYLDDDDDKENSISDLANDWGDTVDTNSNIHSYPMGTHKSRCVSDDVAGIFGVRYSTAPNGDREDIHYPYENDGKEVSWKIRKVPKDFRISGGVTNSMLFGQQLFSPGGKQVVIVEGEEDCLAVAQAFQSHYNKLWPVVSLPSASNLKSVANNLKWLQSFDHIILFMDNDEAGEKAKREIAKMVGYAKCKVVDAKEKDASDMLVKHGYKELMRAIWDSTQYNPQGILTKRYLHPIEAM